MADTSAGSGKTHYVVIPSPDRLGAKNPSSVLSNERPLPIFGMTTKGSLSATC